MERGFANPKRTCTAFGRCQPIIGKGLGAGLERLKHVLA